MSSIDQTTDRPAVRFFLSMINDPRDLPFVYLIIECSLFATLGLGLFFVQEYFWFFAVGYWALGALWVMDRFILMLHCTSHRILFRRPYRLLNQVIPRVLSPFFGETPDTYFTHHMGMHHPENNQPTDLSSTMMYQRDRLAHWLHYFGTFLFTTALQLPIYHFRKGNTKLAVRTMIGEGAFWAVVIALAFINWRATTAVFVVPLLTVRFLMMAGNWAQHAFIDPADPENPYRNSITCINTRYNRRCFNDGYHIYHHVNARCHWTDYPSEFESNRAKYGAEDAVVFDGIDFFEVWLMLMLRRYRSLAKHFVRLPGAPERTDEEVIAFLKSRLTPVTPTPNPAA